MSNHSALRLRTLSWWLTAVVVGVALAVSTALVRLTTYIHQTNGTLASAVENIRLAREIEVALDDLTRSPPELLPTRRAELGAKVDEAWQFVTDANEAAALSEAELRVGEYLIRAAGDPPLSEAALSELRAAALGATDAFVTANVEQSLAAVELAERWDRLADVLGVVAGVCLLCGAGLLLAWLRRRAFIPLLGLARAIEAFARGRRDVRAVEDGPLELREIAQQFNAMADSLAARSAAQVAFLGGVAHDLKNPLQALRLAIEAHRRAPASPARIRRTLDIVGRQTGHLERMVGDFLDITRIESGRLELRLADCDLRELVRDASALFDGDAAHPQTLDLPGEPVIVRCDALRVHQVVVNLLSNACKYSPAGAPVELGVRASGESAIIRVTDRGIGMTAAEIRRIFEPFTRVGLARDTVPGAGLGLHVSEALVHAHGGAIEVESQPGRGSTFRVRLPRAGPRLASAARRSA